MFVISEQQVETVLTTTKCIDLLEQAMVATSSNEAEIPLRWGLPLPGKALMGMMPGYLPNPKCFGIKIVNMMPQNFKSALSSHIGAVLLFDISDGKPLALINGAAITAIRTAAASALATKWLANEEPDVLTLIGTGEQASSHLRSMMAVRDFRKINICSNSLARAKNFVANHPIDGIKMSAFDDVSQAVKNADVICTVTNAFEPFLFSAMLKPGVHVNLVGASTPNKQEADVSMVCQSQYFVDYIPSAMAQAQELIAVFEQHPEKKDIIQAEIGQVITGTSPGRRDKEAITVYRSLGVATQDLCVAWYLYEQAKNKGAGVEVAF